MTTAELRAIAERCAEDMGAGIDFAPFIVAAIETALEEAGRPVGVDLRDRFAMAALTGLLARREWDDRDARYMFTISDAMLAARARKP